MKKINCVLFLLLIGFYIPFMAFADEVDTVLSAVQYTGLVEPYNDVAYYADYAAAQAYDIYHGEPVKIPVENCITPEAVVKDAGKQTLVRVDEGTSVTFEFSVEQTALYAIGIVYRAVAGSGADPELELTVDGFVPFYQAQVIQLDRVWQDAIHNGVFEENEFKDSIRPEQREVFTTRTLFLSDPGMSDINPYLFALEQGSHTLALRGLKESVEIFGFILSSPPALPSYKQVLEVYRSENLQEIDLTEPLVWQAEIISEKSDRSICQFVDRTDPSTLPFSTSAFQFNALGGTNWQYPGQWVSWKVIAPQTGLYRLGFRVLQNFKSGQSVTRVLKINGEVPFREAAEITVAYDGGWQPLVFGNDGTEFLVKLNKGENLITLEASLGNFASVLTEVKGILERLNDAYRQILMLTGASPDPYRDYDIEQEIPQTLTMLQEQSERLNEISLKIAENAGKKGEQNVSLDKTVMLINRMCDNPEQIPRLFRSFKDSIVALGTWLLEAEKQPLAIDTITLLGHEQQMPSDTSGWFKKLITKVQIFLSSFMRNYNVMRSDFSNHSINVWLTSGRDQASIIARMVNSFTAQEKIGVCVQLVSPGSLIPAVFSGLGPDVYIGAAAADPVNYAMRGAVLPLNEFEGFEQICDEFYDSALTPFTYQGKLYALPETQVFPMLFYRTDILSRLGIKHIETWDDIIAMLPTLQSAHMDFGLSSELTTFWTLLAQNGGQIFSPDDDKLLISDDTGVKTMEQWASFYNSYKCPLTYDFVTRFRLGEMPIGIAPYTTYNTLSVFAPEIAGAWTFTMVPGIRQADGKVNHAAASVSTGTVMMANTKEPEAAWAFMWWWASAQTQAMFADELESVMGTAGRYAAANKKVLSDLAWSYREKVALQAQMAQVIGVPEVPGSYLVSRELTFAFRDVVLNGAEARESLTDRVINVNREIARKRKEFGLDGR